MAQQLKQKILTMNVSEVQKNRSRMSSNQIDMMITYMEDHTYFAKGSITKLGPQEDSSSALAAHNEYVANISESLKSVARNQLDQMRVMCENHRCTNSLLEELNSILKNYLADNPISSAFNQENRRVESVEHDIQPTGLSSSTNSDPINEFDENEEIEEMEILEDEVDFDEIMRHIKKSKN
ncbi:hypothetical protein TSAR_005328 [Trichomalopsis sarcophagae]|uniref:Uncharacterized protein n=1 Tax=Trichomalopsis sarcophagae TaxID=543379 RepID=A0A232EEG3_9HYME|nr:hypothetical protein TSAR_005328 [Trichomalopsis sarcophagae]